MTKGMIGFGTESTHEKKVLEMTMQSFALERAVDLKAGRVKDLVNGMLNRYGVMATLALRPVVLDRYSVKQAEMNESFEVVGLEFYDLNDAASSNNVEKQTVDSA